MPYRLISAYGLGGDEYYNEPHFYCSFASKGEPSARKVLGSVRLEP